MFGAGGERAGDGRMVMFSQGGGEIAVENAAGSAGPLDLPLIAGAPLVEPVARYGPFVMNTEAEIYQAVEDYRSGRMGEIDF